MSWRRLLAMLFAGIAPIAVEAQNLTEANAVRGKTVFEVCAPCHSFDAKVNGLGPNLNEIFGRPSASVEGFLYSPSMRRAHIVWTPELLNSYLTNPQSGVFKGNKMPFAGIPDARDRADLIAYIREASKER
jgi:cytochrome c